MAVRFDLLRPAIEVGLGQNVLKLVTYDPPPRQPAAPGGGRAQAGVRFFTIGVQNLRAVAGVFADSEYEILEPVREFAPAPDGNWIELFGTL